MSNRHRIIHPGSPEFAATPASGNFTTDVGWLPFHPNPSKPAFILPPCSIDTHVHVFGPGNQFAYAPQRKYTPVDAPKEKLWGLRDHLGFHKNVIVQATCHGSDNRALVDALRDADGRARGIATVVESVTDAELHQLDEAGVRGVRFNFVKRLVDTTPPDVLRRIAERIAPLGWHVVIYFEAADLPELFDFFANLPTPLVVDHMGRPDVGKNANGPEFDLFVQLMERKTDVWSKVTCPERLTQRQSPDYDDVVPFARRLIDEFPTRVLWGTDWPHPNLKTHMPDDGKLVDFIPRIAPDVAAQQRLLVENPMALYWNR